MSVPDLLRAQGLHPRPLHTHNGASLCHVQEEAVIEDHGLIDLMELEPSLTEASRSNAVFPTSEFRESASDAFSHPLSLI